MPIKVASQEVTRLTVVVSARDDIPVATLTKPARTPQIKSTPGKTTTFRVPLEITVNSHLIHRINIQNSKYRLCSKKTKIREWHKNPNTQQTPPCVTLLNLFVPIELEVPINVESIVEPIEKDADVVVPYKYSERTFDGPEKIYARSQDDYYRSQMAVGDPIRAKRTKRTASNDFFRDTESMVRKIVQAIWRT